MNRKPLVLLSGESSTFAELGSYPNSMDKHPINVYSAYYATAVQEAGGVPVYLPVGLNPIAVIDRVDAVLLTGGADVHPAHYGQAESEGGSAVLAGPHPPQPDRDNQELALISAAQSSGRPILGICRGLQILNVQSGGSLVTDLPDHPRSTRAESTAHPVTFEAGSAMAKMFGESYRVNSLHHQGIDRLAAGWIATGFDHEGRIEAIERADGKALAVQWHPEMMPERATDPLFAWLVAQALVSLEARDGATQYRQDEPALG